MVKNLSLNFLLEKAEALDLKYLTKKGNSLFSKSKKNKNENKKIKRKKIKRKKVTQKKGKLTKKSLKLNNRKKKN